MKSIKSGFSLTAIYLLIISATVEPSLAMMVPSDQDETKGDDKNPTIKQAKKPPHVSNTPVLKVSPQIQSNNNQDLKQSKDTVSKMPTAKPQKKLGKEDILEALKKVKTKALSMEDFVKLLNGESTLTYLNLNGNVILGEDATAFAKALETNRTLTSLDLRCNSTGDEGEGALETLE